MHQLVDVFTQQTWPFTWIVDLVVDTGLDCGDFAGADQISQHWAYCANNLTLNRFSVPSFNTLCE